MEKKFFYDHFTEKDIAGMFNLTHLLYVLVFFGLATLAVYTSRRMKDKTFDKVHLTTAITITVCEIVKIALRIGKNQSIDSWVPLYYCSLFLFAVWLPLTKNKHLSIAGYAYMTMGGVIASVAFTVYPSTSLAIFPIWHPSTIYSGLFHFAMLYLGLMCLIKSKYKPQWKHVLNYFSFVSVFAIPSVILNAKYQTNCLFLRHAFKLPFLEWMIDVSPYFYMAVVFFAQSVLIYLAACGIYKLIEKKINKKKELANELS